jgi:hypothetical protein
MWPCDAVSTDISVPSYWSIPATSNTRHYAGLRCTSTSRHDVTSKTPVFTQGLHHKHQLVNAASEMVSAFFFFLFLFWWIIWGTQCGQTALFLSLKMVVHTLTIQNLMWYNDCRIFWYNSLLLPHSHLSVSRFLSPNQQSIFKKKKVALLPWLYMECVSVGGG